MFSSFKENFSSIDLESLFKELDPRALQDKTTELVKKALHAVDAETKKEVLDWLDTIQSIKNDENLNSKEKQKRISDLKTSEVILRFMGSLVDLLLEKVPLDNKQILKTGLAGGLGLLAATRRAQVAGIALLALYNALPRFIMTSRFDEIAKFFQAELKGTPLA